MFYYEPEFNYFLFLNNECYLTSIDPWWSIVIQFLLHWIVLSFKKKTSCPAGLSTLEIELPRPKLLVLGSRETTYFHPFIPFHFLFFHPILKMNFKPQYFIITFVLNANHIMTQKTILQTRNPVAASFFNLVYHYQCSL